MSLVRSDFTAPGPPATDAVIRAVRARRPGSSPTGRIRARWRP